MSRLRFSADAVTFSYDQFQSLFVVERLAGSEMLEDDVCGNFTQAFATKLFGECDD
jgi:hypothetical protein